MHLNYRLTKISLQKLSILFVLLQTSTICFAQEDEPWFVNRDSTFDSFNSTHFKLYVFKNYIEQDEVNEIFRSRESAYSQISDFLETDTVLKINLFFFEKEQDKIEMVQHRGFGWAFNNTIVEVYNDSIKMDPYHELTHIIGYTRNHPPAIIDEGLAVYLSHTFGDKPFTRLLGYPEKNVNEVLLHLLKENQPIPSENFIQYKEINEASNAPLAYCQAASFVKFLVSEYGKTKFLELFSSLTPEDKESLQEKFTEIYESRLRDIEQKWLVSLLGDN